MESNIGRSPTAIATLLGVSVKTVNGILRHRRDSLSKLADRVPLEVDFLYYTVDPYRMTVEFIEVGSEEPFRMTEKQLSDAIRKSQAIA